MIQRTERMQNFIKEVDSFLNCYEEGAELKIYISSAEKNILEKYVHDHPKGGKNFHFIIGILKPGHLEHDFILRKKI